MNDLVIVKNGKPICNSLMVAEKFEKRHDNVLRDIEKLECSSEFRFLNFEESSYTNSQNKILPMIEMTRDGFSILCMGFTGKEAMAWKEKYIAAFNAMEETIKNGAIGNEQYANKPFEKELACMLFAADMLRMSDVSRLGLTHKVFDKLGVDKSLLPVYVEKKRLTFSASKLLADLGKPLSAVAFNKLMVSEGYLEERSRPSSNGTVKTFKTLTSTGLEFGENLVSPKNDRETQPVYFEDTFKKLVDLLLHSGSDKEPDSE